MAHYIPGYFFVHVFFSCDDQRGVFWDVNLHTLVLLHDEQSFGKLSGQIVINDLLLRLCKTFHGQFNALLMIMRFLCVCTPYLNKTYMHMPVFAKMTVTLDTVYTLVEVHHYFFLWLNCCLRCPY